VEQEAFVKAVALTEELKEIIDNDTNNTYTKEQLSQIVTKTDEIKAAFQE
jgi:hypothetical protein